MKKIINKAMCAFGGLKMNWLTVILFAVGTGLYTGLINCVPFLQNTSFCDIAVTYEWWILFALLVVTNCRKNWEALLKCFVFFLISQPLVYAVEVLLTDLSAQTAFVQYYLHIWFPITLLTLPGGLVAFYAKKQNAVGAGILGVGCAVLCVLGIFYASQCIKNFPYHLMTAIFCFACAVFCILSIQKEKKNRIISFAVATGITVGLVVFSVITGRTLF